VNARGVKEREEKKKEKKREVRTTNEMKRKAKR